jgi:phospholipid/cholesterol/gamma-HCH transport system substrate-binding protein
MKMDRTLIETLLGAAVLVVAGVFIWSAYSSSNIGAARGNEVTARFRSVAGLAPGNDVKMAGIKVGRVVDMRIDPGSYDAIITLALEPQIRLPTDSTARISAEGLLGANFVVLDPGGDEKLIAPGGEITNTQAPIDLVQLLNKIVNGAVENARRQDAAPAAP